MRWDDNWVVRHVRLSCNRRSNTHSPIYLNQTKLAGDQPQRLGMLRRLPETPGTLHIFLKN